MTTRYWLSLAAGALLLGTTGCDGTQDRISTTPEAPAPEPTAQLQVVHGVADAPEVRVLGNGEALITFSFGEASPRATLAAGNVDVLASALLPDGSLLDVIEAPGFTLEPDLLHTIFASGRAGGDGPAVMPLVATRSISAGALPGSGEARVQIVHGAALAPPVDVFVTAIDAPLASASPVASFAFGDSTEALTVPAGEYRVRVTLPDTPDAVVFDAVAALPAGADWTIAAQDYTRPQRDGLPAIKLLAATSDGAVLVLDDNAPARITAIHASPDAGSVDVFAAPEGTLDAGTPAAFAGLAYGSAASACIDAGTYDIAIAGAGMGADNAVDALGVSGLTLQGGDSLVAVASGEVNGAAPLALLGIPFDERRIATEARLTVVHGAPVAGAVDVYVTPAGSVAASALDTADPALSAFMPGDVAGPLRVMPASYDVRITAAGDPTQIIVDVEGVAADAGFVGIATAIGPDASGEDAVSEAGLLLDVVGGDC